MFIRPNACFSAKLTRRFGALFKADDIYIRLLLIYPTLFILSSGDVHNSSFDARTVLRTFHQMTQLLNRYVTPLDGRVARNT